VGEIFGVPSRRWRPTEAREGAVRKHKNTTPTKVIGHHSGEKRKQAPGPKKMPMGKNAHGGRTRREPRSHKNQTTKLSHRKRYPPPRKKKGVISEPGVIIQDVKAGNSPRDPGEERNLPENQSTSEKK